jgi:tRNA wybutosine-synthesizing protein 4
MLRHPLHLDEEDQAIRGTNDEATIGKLSAVTRGYYRDDFVSAFGPRRAAPHLLPPLMNRGHYARSMAIQTVAERFLTQVVGLPSARQIVSLGCGYDTLYFRLRSAHRAATECLRYFELDFEQVANKKRGVMAADARFQPFLAEAERYVLLDCDLRSTAELAQRLLSGGFALDAPTLFLSECALIYMSAEEGGSIIRWAAKLPHAFFCTYEQIRPHDAFGKTMIRNLEARNIPLHSLLRYPELPDQRRRYVEEGGFGRATARTMLQVFDSFLPPEDTRRIAGIEMFDEFEEWQLILSHYCLVVAGPLADDALWSAIKFLE